MVWLSAAGRSAVVAAADAYQGKQNLAAVEAGLLRPAAILNVAHKKKACNDKDRRHMVGKALQALALYGSQPRIGSVPGYCRLMKYITKVSWRPDDLVMVAEGLACVGADVPARVAETFAEVMSEPSADQLTVCRILASFGRCTGTGSAMYQRLLQVITNKLVTSLDWAHLLRSLAYLQYNADKTLLRRASSAILEAEQDREDTAGLVR